MKLTFKKYPREKGLAAVGYPNQSADIKLNKKVIGRIDAPNWMTKDNLWRVSITIKDSTQEGVHRKWVSCKARFETDEAARVAAPIFIQAMIDKGYELYLGED